jgi:hypothetical protein
MYSSACLMRLSVGVFEPQRGEIFIEMQGDNPI